jgi:hypothetical protein
MTRAIEPSPKKPTRYEPVLNEIEIAFCMRRHFVDSQAKLRYSSFPTTISALD